MKNYYLIPTCIVFAAIPFSVFASSVVINEVMFDPEGSDTGGEWIELYNASEKEVDISGWEIYPDGIGYITIPNGFSIGAKKFTLIHLRTTGNNSSTDIYQATSSSNMSNTSGSVALFSAEPRGKDTIKGFVQWGKGGETWESSAMDAGLWEKGMFVDIGSFSEGNSLALQTDGTASSGKNAWHISGISTPKTANSGSIALSSPLPSISPSLAPLSGSSAEPSSLPAVAMPHTSPIKTIHAYAGEDMSSMVGIMLDFLGHAKGINDKAIDSSARFFWNFGDGETREGRSVGHIYQAPGVYLASLHISSGEYAASDHVRVQISPNFVSISGVVLGGDGYIRFANASDIEADISGWNIRDNQQRTFIFPSHSKLARRGDIAIMNSVTGLLKNSESLPIRALYPNGVEAFVFSDIISLAHPQDVKKENVLALRPEDSHIAEVKKIVPSAAREHPVISSFPTPVPPFTPRQESSATYAAAARAPFVSAPLAIALGISVLSATGFLIAKR